MSTVDIKAFLSPMESLYFWRYNLDYVLFRHIQQFVNIIWLLFHCLENREQNCIHTYIKTESVALILISATTLL